MQSAPHNVVHTHTILPCGGVTKGFNKVISVSSKTKNPADQGQGMASTIKPYHLIFKKEVPRTSPMASDLCVKPPL